MPNFNLRNPLNATLINNLRNFNVFTQILTLAASASTSVHDVLAFVIPILFTFVQTKNPNKNLFETHPVTINIVLYSLLAYSMAFGVRHRLLYPRAAWFHMAMLFFGSISLASLLSLVFPHHDSRWQPTLCVLGILLLLGLLVLAFVRKLWNQIQQQIGRRPRRFPRPLSARRLRVSRSRPLLPLSSSDLPPDQVGPLVLIPMNIN